MLWSITIQDQKRVSKWHSVLSAFTKRNREQQNCYLLFLINKTPNYFKMCWGFIQVYIQHQWLKNNWNTGCGLAPPLPAAFSKPTVLPQIYSWQSYQHAAERNAYDSMNSKKNPTQQPTNQIHKTKPQKPQTNKQGHEPPHPPIPYISAM